MRKLPLCLCLWRTFAAKQRRCVCHARRGACICKPLSLSSVARVAGATCAGGNGTGRASRRSSPLTARAAAAGRRAVRLGGLPRAAEKRRRLGFILPAFTTCYRCSLNHPGLAALFWLRCTTLCIPTSNVPLRTTISLSCIATYLVKTSVLLWFRVAGVGFFPPG